MNIPHSTTLAALTWCLLMVPAAYATDDQAIEAECRQAATEDHVPMKDMDDYMEDCMSEAMRNLDEEGGVPSEDDTQLGHRGEEETAPEGDQEPAPAK